MYKINIKESILEIVEKNNLEILKIDLMNGEESFVRSYSKERNEFCKVYTTLEDLDFKVYSTFWHDKVRGTVYCRDKDTKEPVWIVSRGDEVGSWWEVNRVPEFYKNNLQSYRVKSEFKYRPFKDAEECWHEMLKHQPFGWIKAKDASVPSKFMIISSVKNKEISITLGIDFTYNELLKCYTFADGTPFGIKKEE